MTHSEPVKTPRKGQFKKGHDPHRNMAGNKNAARQSYTVRFNNALAEGLSPEEFAAICIEDVRRHRPGAKEFYADRLMGKISQPLEHSGDIGFRVIDRVIKTETEA